MKFSDKSKVKTSRDFNGTLDTTFTNVTLGFTDLPTSAPPMVMNFAFDTEKVKNTSITADAKKTPAAEQAQQTILDDLAKDAEAAGGTLVGAAVVDPVTGKSSLKYVIGFSASQSFQCKTSVVFVRFNPDKSPSQLFGDD